MRWLRQLGQIDSRPTKAIRQVTQTLQAMDYFGDVHQAWAISVSHNNDQGDVNNENKYVEKINNLLSDKNKLERFKNASFKRAQFYDIDKIVPLYDELYKKLLK